MASPLYLSLSLILLLLLLIACTDAAFAVRSFGPPSSLVRSSCLGASFPAVCIRTLSTYPDPPRTPYDLARAAVSVSYLRAKKASKYLAQASARLKGAKRIRGTMRDCVEQMSDSTAELSDTLRELKSLETGSFRRRMSNAETWVSAALTDQDTCLDEIMEIRGGGDGAAVVGGDLKRKVKNVAKITSNALYLINRLDEARGSP
ncbi:hypothetical protein Dimus_002484 [Dionaea muscipula]